MTSQIKSPLHAGQVLEVTFPTFTPRITIHSERELTVQIIAGDNAGFADRVEYEAVPLRDDLVMVSWQEHIGSTVVQVVDFKAKRSYTAVTPVKGPFMRLTGSVKVTSAT
jgi:hypothetical protein